MQIGLVIYGSLRILSGGYLYDRKLVEFLQEQGDTVEIFSLPWRNYAAHLTDNLHFRLPAPNHIAREANQSPTQQRLDILIQDELDHPSLIAANAGKHLYPVISLVHHLRCSELRPRWQNSIYRVIEKKYLESVDGFIFNSKTTERTVNRLIGNGKPSIVAYPPTDQFGEAISEEQIINRAKTSPFRILFLGNVIERKGLHTLLEAIRNQPSSIRLDIVGSLDSEPEYVKQIQQYVAVHNLHSRVLFHGPVARESLIERLGQSHVLVVPSSYEGYGIVYLEGMCFGLPAIGTTAGAAGEIITDEVDGFLIPPEDADSLAKKLGILSEKRDVLLHMSLSARERYIRQPKWEQTASQIRDFLLRQIREFSV